MILHVRRESQVVTKPAIGLTMFGVTTPCVQAVSKALEAQYDCLTFHATGTGGQSMEKLVDSGLLTAVIDVTTTEVADELVGGVFSAGPQRMEAIIRARIPYVGSCGALDMANFHAVGHGPRALPRSQSVQAQSECHADAHHAAGECADRRVDRRQAQSHGRPGALSDSPGRRLLARLTRAGILGSGADQALFSSIETGFRPTSTRRLIKLPYNINDPEFAQALVDQFHEIAAQPVTSVPEDSSWPVSLVRPSSSASAA